MTSLPRHITTEPHKFNLRKKLPKRLMVGLLTMAMFGGLTWFHQSAQSANLTTVSVTLSNPRPSFRGALASGNTVGSSIVTINTTQNAYPSTSSAQLVEGDVVRIGSAGTLNSYTVASTSSLASFNITSTLASGDTEAGDDVIATNSAVHTVRFTTANAIANGRFRILVPALANNTAAGDGIPDGGYFDFGTTTPTVTCPADQSGYDFVSGTASVSAITLDGNDYHAFECAYSGAGGVGTAFTSGSNVLSINSLINPAPKTNHTTGYADTYPVIVQQLNSSFSVADQTSIQIGVIEAVKVSASVPAQITFQILGLATGTSACGVTTDVTTTAASVPFGEISISNFTDAAQALTVSTNAVNGFSVTAIENDQLGKDGGACAGDPTITSNTSCIADARGDNGTMANTTSADWNNAVNKGFAYSLHDVNSTTTEAFAYNESARTFSARQFPDAAASDTTVQLFSATGPADNQNLYVCYRIVAGSTTAAGYYENYVTYNATATF